MAVVVNIRLASDRVNHSLETTGPATRLYTPGEVVASKQDFMRGHGTYIEDDDIKASVAGYMEKVNKLIRVQPLKSRYFGEIGDVIVGRVVEVQKKRWKIDINSRLNAVLMLSSVNLAGGELRKRSVEDEHMMRKYLQEGDLISAEVQSLFSDGCLSLHTRSLKYGKLSQGILLKVFPSLVLRRKNHFHNLPCGVSVILGNNGFLWITPVSEKKAGGAASEGDGGFKQNLDLIPKFDRERVARVRNCILAMAASKMLLYDTSINYAYEESFKYEDVKDLLDPEAMLDVAFLTQQRLNSTES